MVNSEDNKNKNVKRIVPNSVYLYDSFRYYFINNFIFILDLFNPLLDHGILKEVNRVCIRISYDSIIRCNLCNYSNAFGSCHHMDFNDRYVYQISERKNSKKIEQNVSMDTKNYPVKGNLEIIRYVIFVVSIIFVYLFDLSLCVI